MSTAQANADLKYGTVLDAIKRRISGVQAGMAANETALQGYGNTGRGVIGQTYDVLDQALAGNRADTANQLAASANQIGQGYRDAQSVLDTQRGIARDYAAQAGVANQQQDSFAKNQARLENVIADLIGRNAAQDATATGNLRNWSSQMDSILSKGQDIGRQQRADAASRFENSLLNALSENRLNAQLDETDLQGNLLSTLTERGNFLVSESDRLAQQAWERAIEEARLSQAAQQANAELALRQRAMDAENARIGEDDRWKMLEWDLRNRQFERGVTESDRDYQLRLAAMGQEDNTDRLNALRIASDPNFALMAPEYKAEIDKLLGLDPTARYSGAVSGAGSALAKLARPSGGGGGGRSLSGFGGFFDKPAGGGNADDFYPARLIKNALGLGGARSKVGNGGWG